MMGCRPMWLSSSIGRLKRQWPKSLDHYRSRSSPMPCMHTVVQALLGIEGEIDLWAKGRLQPRSDRAPMTLPRERLASDPGPLSQMAKDGSRGLNDMVPHYKKDWGTEWGTGDGQKKKKPLKSAAYLYSVAEGEGWASLRSAARRPYPRAPSARTGGFSSPPPAYALFQP